MQNEAKEMQEKYNKVKLAFHLIKDKASIDTSEADTDRMQLSELKQVYEKLVVDHELLQRSSNERVTLLKKRDDKTKQILQKVQKDLKECKDQIREKD